MTTCRCYLLIQCENVQKIFTCVLAIESRPALLELKDFFNKYLHMTDDNGVWQLKYIYLSACHSRVPHERQEMQ